MAQEKDNTDEKKPAKNLPNQFSLTARMLVGAYLLYTAYSLINSFINGGETHKYILGAFIIFFTVIGILLILFSGRDLLRGKYAGGRMDMTEEPEKQEEQNVEGAAEKDAAPAERQEIMQDEEGK